MSVNLEQTPAEQFMFGFQDRLNTELQTAKENNEILECHLLTYTGVIIAHKVRAVLPEAIRVDGFLSKHPVTLLIHVNTAQFAFMRFQRDSESTEWPEMGTVIS